MPALTRRQQDILTFLQDREREGEAPTLEQICRAFGLRSRGSLHKHISALAEAGLVQPMQGRRRGVHLTEAATAGAGLPLLGRIAAGRPIEAVADNERIAVPEVLRSGGDCYVLQVRGDSMIDDGIHDGDWVIVEHREHAANGELVVALVNDDSATLKRIEQRPGEVVLHPANADHEPQHYPPDAVAVQGIVVGQMRRYQ